VIRDTDAAKVRIGIFRRETPRDTEGSDHAGLISRLRSLVEEVRELPDGYTLRFKEDGSAFGRLAEWVRHERPRFPFLRFEILVEGRSGPIRLRLRGPLGIKDFLKREFPILRSARPVTS
jgi:hypothetical protein